MSCKHHIATTTPSGAFQICEGCGAVRARVAGKPGVYDEWHICKLCSATQEIRDQLASAEAIIRQVSEDTFGHPMTPKQFAEASGYDS